MLPIIPKLKHITYDGSVVKVLHEGEPIEFLECSFDAFCNPQATVMWVTDKHPMTPEVREQLHYNTTSNVRITLSHNIEIVITMEK